MNLVYTWLMAPRSAHPAPSPSRRRVWLALQVLCTAAVIWFIFARLATDFDLEELRRSGITLGGLSWTSLVAATCLMIAGTLAASAVWGMVVGDLGGPRLTHPLAMKIWLVGSLGRYVPGRIFGLVGVVAMARRWSVPSSIAAAAAGLATLVALVTAGFVGSLLFVGPGPEIGAGRWLVLGLASGLAIGIHVPAVRSRVLNLWYRATRTEATGKVPLTKTLAWTALGLASWAGMAGAFSFLAASVGLEIPLLVAGPAFSFAWILGFVSPLPLGVGVREAGLMGLLAGHAEEGALIGLVLFARLWMTLVELLVTAIFGIAAGSGTASAGGSPSANRSKSSSSRRVGGH